MALKYNGTSPTAIKYNGTDLTVLKYGTTSVWGKPYSLSISAGSNTSVSVERTSSPNQHASTGTLSSGSVVYYGDVLKITASASSGYKLSTFTVNGTSWTSGNTITVSSAINVVTTAEASASWHTVWSGSVKATWGSSLSTKKLTISSTLKTGVPTRCNYSIYASSDFGHINGSSSMTNGTIPTYKYIYSDLGDGSYAQIGIASYGSNYINCISTGDYGFDSPSSSSITVTKIEQYY